MIDWQTAVTKFHTAFGHPAPTGPPSFKHVRTGLRIELMQEELGETIKGLEAGDMVETADGIGDLVWVAVGLAVELGINMAPVFAAIAAANMAKLGPDGKPIYRESDNKILKPAGWKPADVAAVLNAQGWQG